MLRAFGPSFFMGRIMRYTTIRDIGVFIVTGIWLHMAKVFGCEAMQDQQWVEFLVGLWVLFGFTTAIGLLLDYHKN